MSIESTHHLLPSKFLSRHRKLGNNHFSPKCTWDSPFWLIRQKKCKLPPAPKWSQTCPQHLWKASLGWPIHKNRLAQSSANNLSLNNCPNFSSITFTISWLEWSSPSDSAQGLESECTWHWLPQLFFGSASFQAPPLSPQIAKYFHPFSLYLASVDLFFTH